MKITEATIRVPGNIKVNKISGEIIYKAFAIAVEQKKKETFCYSVFQKNNDAALYRNCCHF